jgi:hypothetical protein
VSNPDVLLVGTPGTSHPHDAVLVPARGGRFDPGTHTLSYTRSDIVTDIRAQLAATEAKLSRVYETRSVIIQCALAYMITDKDSDKGALRAAIEAARTPAPALVVTSRCPNCGQVTSSREKP